MAVPLSLVCGLWMTCLLLLAALDCNAQSSLSNQNSSVAGTNRIIAPPPMPSSGLTTPIQYFRKLLTMTEQERKEALKGRTSEIRAFLTGKIKEFEALPPADREAQLQTLELRYFLLPLMKMQPSMRPTNLVTMSEAQRKLVYERLDEWDKLPADLKHKVLENENVVRLFFRSETNRPNLDITLPGFNEAQRKRMTEEQARWNMLPEEERQKVLTQFERFFTLKPKEKSGVLDLMNENERRIMERTLQSFSKLPEDKREQCLKGFDKFASLTPQERQEFLINAERWQSMSAKDRQLWRELVIRLQIKPPPFPTRRPLPTTTAASSAPPASAGNAN